MIRPAHSTAEGVADHLSYASCPIHLSAPILTRFKKPACAPLERAKELVAELSDADISARAREVAESGVSDRKKHVPKPDFVDRNQLSLFDTNSDDEILKEIDSLELSTMTPIDALNTLYSLQAKRKNRWQG